MVNKNHKEAFCLPLDLPLPRFAGLKNEPEMRYPTVPPSIDGQGAQCGTAPGSLSWTPADRSAFRHLEANVEKKVSLRWNFFSSKTCNCDKLLSDMLDLNSQFWVWKFGIKHGSLLRCPLSGRHTEEVFRVDQEWCTEQKTLQSAIIIRAERPCWWETRGWQASFKVTTCWWQQQGQHLALMTLFWILSATSTILMLHYT